MNPGELRHRITIKKLKKIKVNGFDDVKWEDYKTVWAGVNNLFGKEYWEAKAIQSENTIEFVIRFSKDVGILNSKEYRIVFNNKIYNITFVDNIKYQNKWLKIKAVEVD